MCNINILYKPLFICLLNNMLLSQANVVLGIYIYTLYRVCALNLILYIFGPTGSHIYRTGQNEIPLEPHSAHEDFDISHAQIGHS